MRIMINIQVYNGRVHPVCFELASKAREICRMDSGDIEGILLCSQYDNKLAEDISRLGLDSLYVYEHQNFRIFRLDEQAMTICSCIREYMPEILLFGATIEGRSLAPVVAAAFGTGVTADCTALDINSDGLLVQTRPAYGGRIMAEIITRDARPQIATVRYGVFKAGNIIEKMPKVMIKQSAEVDSVYRVEKIQGIFDNSEFGKAPVVVAVGGGIRKKEDIVLFEAFARRLGAELMCSRVLVERGWMEQSRQIGLSGCSIEPELLITLGIYGSCQFIAGIRNAGVLCAVNTDVEAPIFEEADYCICSDIYEMIQAFPV